MEAPRASLSRFSSCSPARLLQAPWLVRWKKRLGRHTSLLRLQGRIYLPNKRGEMLFHEFHESGWNLTRVTQGRRQVSLNSNSRWRNCIARLSNIGKLKIKVVKICCLLCFFHAGWNTEVNVRWRLFCLFSFVSIKVDGGDLKCNVSPKIISKIFHKTYFSWAAALKLLSQLRMCSFI